MDTRAYYHQSPITRRILEYSDGAVSVSGANPEIKNARYYRRYDDLLEAMGEGCDLYRSNLDFNGPVLALDFEYGNCESFGEVFHKPMEVFEKFEPTRVQVRNVLKKHGVQHIELMTGQGYNYVMRVGRKTASYKSLLTLGRTLCVLPRSVIDRLHEKERQYGNVPLVDDNLVFAAFGRITDYIMAMMPDEGQLTLRSSDLYDSTELAIFDTTLFAYAIHRRSIRCAFSLHQKTKMKAIYGYDGPPIVAIPSKGVSLEERLKIRQDERNNYERAVRYAEEVQTHIPTTDLGSLITSYMSSETYEQHKAFAADLLCEPGDGAGEGRDDDVWKLTNWDVLDHKLSSSNLDEDALSVLADPNARLLEPWWLRHIVHSLRDRGFSFSEVVSVITSKYNGPFGWESELLKGDTAMRAEYWTRTLWHM